MGVEHWSAAELAPAVRARISGDRIQVAIYSRGEIPDAE